MQLDVKRVIAYSSVSHMILIPFLVINNREIGSKIINIIIFSHAFSSIVLFFLGRFGIQMFTHSKLIDAKRDNL